MLPLGHAIRRRLVPAAAAIALTLVPLTVAAADVDSLWNPPQGTSPTSAFYVIQSWWDGFNRRVSDDSTRRGLDELAEANADLLTAYTLLQEQHNNPGPQPVAFIDPLLSSAYNAITGSNVKAPVGAVFHWINRSLLSLEGRGSTNDMVRHLLQDYRATQAVALRDLYQQPGEETESLISANTERERSFLNKIKAVSRPDDGLKSLLEDADRSTVALAARHRAGDFGGNGKALGHDKQKSKDNGKPSAPQPNKK
jgi:hypothetical protein